MSLFIGNISERIPKEYLIQELQKFGDVEVNYFVTVTQGKFAFVEYSDLNAAPKALLAWNGRVLDGHILYIEYTEKYPTPTCKQDSPHSDSFPLNGSSPHKEPLSTSSESHIKQMIDKQLQTTSAIAKLIVPAIETKLNDAPIQNPEPDTNLNPGPAIDLNLQTLDVVEESIEKATNKAKNRQKMKKNMNVAHVIGENVCEAYGSVFKLKRINKTKDENSIVICELCQREFKKKSIRSHVKSLIHQSKFS